MSANLCLIAWNEPIGTPNCSRCFAYSSEMSKSCCAAPTASRARQVVAELAGSPERGDGARPRRRRARASAPTATPSSVTVASTRLGSSASIGVIPARVDGTTNAPTPSSPVGAGAAGNDDHRSARGRLEDRSASCRAACSRRAVGVATVVVAPGSIAAGRLRAIASVPLADAVGDGARRAAPVPVSRARRRGDELGDRGEERAGRERPAELLGDERELDRTEPEAARALRHRQRGPAELDHLRLQRVGVAGVARERARRSRGRAPIGHSAARNAADRVAEVFLVGSKSSSMGRGPYPASRAGSTSARERSRGRPSRRR